MRRSKSEIDLHFVWATYACILHEAARQECEVLALGGMPDHVHLALTMPAKCCPATLMRCIKGVSSTFARQKLAHGELFGWQDGYAAYSVCRTQRETVLSYIRSQKRHHAEETIQPAWEEVDEETPAQNS